MFSKAKRFPYSADLPAWTFAGTNGGGKMSKCSNSTRQNMNRTFTKHSVPTPLASPPTRDTKIPPKCNNEDVSFEDTFEKFKEDFERRRNPKLEPFHLHNDLKNLKENLAKTYVSQRNSSFETTEEVLNKLISRTVTKVVTGNETKIREAVKCIADFNLAVVTDLSKELTSRVTAIRDTVAGNKEEDFRRLVSLLLLQVEDGKRYAEFLERNYMRILKAAHKEIEEQAAVIEALRAEIDAGEMNRRIKNILRK